MGGINSTIGVEQNVHDELQSKYNRMRGNYETEKLVSQSLKENIEKLEKKIVDYEVKLDNITNINEEDKKLLESIKSTYESELINKENIICELEDLLENNKQMIKENENTNIKNEEIINKNEKTIEELRNKNIKLSNENKNGKFLENKYKILEDSCKTQEKTIDELKELNNELNNKVIELKELNNELNDDFYEINEKNINYEAKLIEIQSKKISLLNEINSQEEKQNILNKKICVIINTINYFKDNKNSVIEDILKKNNTIIPDFMERNLIENIYNYIINKIDMLIKA